MVRVTGRTGKRRVFNIYRTAGGRVIGSLTGLEGYITRYQMEQIRRAARNAQKNVREIRRKNTEAITQTSIIPQLVQAAALTAITDTITLLLPQYARKTGAFRQAIREMLAEQIRDVALQKQTKIDFDIFAVIQRVFYAKWHIDGKPWHPGDTSPYAKPTTPGTRPVDSEEFMAVYATFVEVHLKRLLNAAQGRPIN